MAVTECPLCKGEMEQIGEKEISGTKYRLLKCKKCNHQVARSER